MKPQYNKKQQQYHPLHKVHFDSNGIHITIVILGFKFRLRLADKLARYADLEKIRVTPKYQVIFQSSAVWLAKQAKKFAIRRGKP
jgi:hypothetical protein